MNKLNWSNSGMAGLLDGIASYGVFPGVFLYAIGFIGGFFTPTTLTISSMPSASDI